MTEEQPGNVAIRTPDQRLRVFVSSTLAELAEERAAVARAISALRLPPGVFCVRCPTAPPSRAVPGLPRAVRHLHRAVLAAVRVGRAGHGHLGTRGRVSTLP